MRETLVTPKNFIYPLFIHEEDFKQEISSMPGAFRHSMKTMMDEIKDLANFDVIGNPPPVWKEEGDEEEIQAIKSMIEGNIAIA